MEHTFSLDSIYWELAHFSALTPDSKANNITSKSLQTSSGNNEIYTNSQPQCFFKIPQEKWSNFVKCEPKIQNDSKR